MKKVIHELVVAAMSAGILSLQFISITSITSITEPAQAAEQCKWRTVTKISVEGYCGGRGPDSYRAWLSCTDRKGYYGKERWQGDGRGSKATCGGGTVAAYGFDLFDN